MNNQGNVFARGGVLITTGRYDPDSDKIEERSFYAFIDQNLQCELEEQATRLYEKDMTIQLIINELASNFKASLGRLVMWICMKSKFPDVTIEEAGQYAITLRIKHQLIAAIENSHLSDEELSRIADRLEQAGIDLQETQIKAVEATVTGKSSSKRKKKR